MMELLDDVYHTKSCFGLFGDSVSRVSVRGILTDAHNEIPHTQVEALNSTL